MLALPAALREAIGAGGSGLSILVLRLGAMGDIVRTLPAVRLVRRGLPHARIHWVAWDPWIPLLRDHPAVDTVVGLPRSELRRWARSPLTWPALIRATRGIASQLGTLEPGLALDFHGDFRTGLLGRVSGAPVRLGYDGHQQKEGNRAFTTHRVPAGERRRSRIERNLDLVRALGLPDSPMPDAGIAIGPEDTLAAEQIARSLAAGSGAYAVLNPGASRRQAFKRPPPALLAAAARALAESGVCPLVVCGPGEEVDADRVLAAAKGLARRAPATSLKTLAALLSGARVFVGGDSGPLHLACGVGCPVVGLYGPTDPVVNAPWHVPFAALVRPGSSHTGIKARDKRIEGFEGLQPQAVDDAIRGILARPRVAPLAR
jgi:ADP-heptose:LPS heptosyltransferase